MANEEKSAVDQRLQNAVYGTPKSIPMSKDAIWELFVSESA